MFKPTFQAMNARLRAQMPEYCAVAAIVHSCEWPEGTKIDWHFLDAIKDWAAHLTTDNPEVKQVWLELCELLRTIPDADKNDNAFSVKATDLALAKIRGKDWLIR